MSIFEFDEEKAWKLIREAEYQYGVEVGIEQGRNLERKNHLIQMICKKLRKGTSVERIAAELEEEIEVVRNICDVAKDYAPEYKEEDIVQRI